MTIEQIAHQRQMFALLAQVGIEDLAKIHAMPDSQKKRQLLKQAGNQTVAQFEARRNVLLACHCTAELMRSQLDELLRVWKHEISITHVSIDELMRQLVFDAEIGVL